MSSDRRRAQKEQARAFRGIVGDVRQTIDFTILIIFFRIVSSKIRLIILGENDARWPRSSAQSINDLPQPAYLIPIRPDSSLLYTEKYEHRTML